MMKPEVRVGRRNEEVGAWVTTDGVVTANMDVQFAGHWVQCGLECSDVWAVFDQICDEDISGYGRGLFAEVTLNASRVVA